MRKSNFRNAKYLIWISPMNFPHKIGISVCLIFAFAQIAFGADTPHDVRKTQTFQKPWQKLNLGLTWLPSDGNEGLGMTRLNFDVTFPFAVPQARRTLASSYFTVTPKFEYTDINWKRDTEFPDTLYDAGIGLTWVKPINERWSFMANATPRWASDGHESSNAARCSAMLGLNWTPNDRWKVLFGFAYLDREDDMNFLPYGGLIWTPNSDFRLELTAPRARIAKRLYSPSLNLSEQWAYLGFEIGGGCWAIRSQDHRADIATYREYSLLLGYEATESQCCTFNFEIAYTLGREIEFDKKTQCDFEPDDSISLRARLTF